MLSSYLTGLIAVVAVTLAWVAVQGAWRRAFPEAGPDPDALAGRMGCAGRGCGGGRCAADVCAPDVCAMTDRTTEDIQLEHDGRLGMAVEEIP